MRKEYPAFRKAENGSYLTPNFEAKLEAHSIQAARVPARTKLTKPKPHAYSWNYLQHALLGLQLMDTFAGKNTSLVYKHCMLQTQKLPCSLLFNLHLYHCLEFQLLWLGQDGAGLLKVAVEAVIRVHTKSRVPISVQRLYGQLVQQQIK